MLTLVIVSLVSAGIGAVVMVTLLHCRRSVQRRFSLFYVSLPTKFQSLFYSTAARNIPPISHTFQLSQFYDHERCYDIERERERFIRWNFEWKYENVFPKHLRAPRFREIDFEIHAKRRRRWRLDTDRRSARSAKRSRFSSDRFPLNYHLPPQRIEMER